MTKTEKKHEAQSELLSAMQVAFDRNDDPEMGELMSKQMERVEKLFGYEPGSFARGC